jgi:hypothetical protein
MNGPLWKRAYDSVEKQAGPALTQFFSKPEVVEAVTLGMAVQRRARDDLGEVIRRGLHSVNLPSGTDVRKVSNQIAGLEREIRLLSRQVEELQADDE